MQWCTLFINHGPNLFLRRFVIKSSPAMSTHQGETTECVRSRHQLTFNTRINVIQSHLDSIARNLLHSLNFQCPARISRPGDGGLIKSTFCAPDIYTPPLLPRILILCLLHIMFCFRGVNRIAAVSPARSCVCRLLLLMGLFCMPEKNRMPSLEIRC